MKRRRANTSHINVAIFKDISFPRTCPGTDYNTTWNGCFHDRNIFAITSCYESAVLFASPEGWIRADAPVCQRSDCIVKHSDICKRKSYTHLILALYWYIALANTIIMRHVLLVSVAHILLGN